MTDLEFIAIVTHRLEQRARGLMFPPTTVFSIRDAALHRLAGRVSRDAGLYTLLQTQYDLTLNLGEASLLGLQPTLLLSKETRKFWLITMTGVDHSIKLLNSITDLNNPPPVSSFYYATVFQWKLLVRDSAKAIPEETALQLFGNGVPLLTDPVFEEDGELRDDLIDVAVELLLESKNPAKADQEAQETS